MGLQIVKNLPSHSRILDSTSKVRQAASAGHTVAGHRHDVSASKAGLIGTCLAACTLLVAACSSPPRMSPEDLAYPVLVLFPQSGSVRHDDAADLGVMSVQRVMGAHGPVMLIDSRLDIYRLDALASEHSGLWLMAHPNGQTDVRFELQRIGRADIKLARRLILEREPSLRGAGEPAPRAAVLKATTLQAMLQIIGK
jgi:hypothetical protein